MGKTILKYIWRTFLVFLTLILLLLILIFGAVTVISKGPSDTAKKLFVNTVKQTSAAGFLADIYFSEEEIEAYMNEGEEVPDTEYSPESLDMVNIPVSEPEIPAAAVSENEAEGVLQEAVSAEEEQKISADINPAAINTDDDGDGIEYVKIVEEGFNGDLLIVYDPSRIEVYSIKSFAETGYGKKITDIIEETGAVAAINAGGFYDPDGHGHGGMPLGPVIQNGQLVSNFASDWYTLIGFTKEHKLMAGNMGAYDAIAAGMYEGITFGPVLVSNGKAVDFGATRGGLNPRSAIGQRVDGAVLLLTINGRQPGSLGATYQDTADLLVKYGAVTAANLDGGSSSRLFYKGEQLNKSSSLLGMRPVPNAIIVKNAG
ncbi:MAG: phosphodiester glycosidase family protein [Lachnospiraceae bacterium]|nr:phosphodiester glycosidase family protein [Lachnospiraceae bacterium]